MKILFGIVALVACQAQADTGSVTFTSIKLVQNVSPLEASSSEGSVLIKGILHEGYLREGDADFADRTLLRAGMEASVNVPLPSCGKLANEFILSSVQNLRLSLTGDLERHSVNGNKVELQIKKSGSLATICTLEKVSD